LTWLKLEQVQSNICCSVKRSFFKTNSGLDFLKREALSGGGLVMKLFDEHLDVSFCQKHYFDFHLMSFIFGRIWLEIMVGSVVVAENPPLVFRQHPHGQEGGSDDHQVETDPLLVTVQPQD
jgi:hypothetical protein